MLHARLASLLSILAASSALALGYAWWITVRFVPSETTLAGILVGQIDPTWKRASLLKDAALPPEASQPGESLADHSASFVIDADLDADGHQESAAVGVYETTDGNFGRFLLINNDDQRSLLKLPGEAGFSALWHKEGVLSWATCMECDYYCDIKSSTDGYHLACYSGSD